jgi:hypothetical protein
MTSWNGYKGKGIGGHSPPIPFPLKKNVSVILSGKKWSEGSLLVLNKLLVPIS